MKHTHKHTHTHLHTHIHTCTHTHSLTHTLTHTHTHTITLTHRLGDEDQSIQYLKQSVEIAEKFNNDIELSRACSSLGLMCNNNVSTGTCVLIGEWCGCVFVVWVLVRVVVYGCVIHTVYLH